MTELSDPLQSTQPPGSASNKEKYDFLIAILKESRYGLVDFAFKQGAVLMLFLGWILTSDKAREFIGGALPQCILTAILVLLYAAAYILWILTWRRRSSVAFEHLEKLSYMPVEYYSPLRISTGVIVSFILLHCAVCLIMVIYLFLMFFTPSRHAL
jgi:hypothetical protein